MTDYLTTDFWQSGESIALSEGAPLERAPAGSILVQSSGTEGRPKWVVLPKRSFLISARSVNAHLDARAEDRWLIALPLTHVGGFSIYARALLAGCSVEHLPGRWEVQQFMEVCEAQRITLTSLVPAQVYDLVHAGVKAPPSLRAIVVGGAGLDRELGAQARALGWPVLQSYGMTEAASQIATEPLDHVRSAFEPDVLEVLPHWQVSTDADGHLVLRGPALASGFLVADAAGGWQWQPLDAEAGLVTRDRVALSQDGLRTLLRFEGRASMMLKILGELVSLSSLQGTLDRVASARGLHGQCALVPVPDERRGQSLVLAHSLEPEVAESLRTAFDAEVRPFERVSRCVRVPEIPLTRLGKVRVEDLRALVQEAIAKG